MSFITWSSGYPAGQDRFSPLEGLPARGAYTILMFASRVKANIGSLGVRTLSQGHYTYTGSAQGKGSTNLRNRLARHMKTQKKKHWHIDYLLPNSHVKLQAILIVPSDERIECKVNQIIRKELVATTPIMGFGSTDCGAKCKSHLLFFPPPRDKEGLINKMTQALTQLTNGQTVRVIRLDLQIQD